VSAVEPRLTMRGFGFSLANGDYANPFYNGSNYYEYLSVPPYKNGAGPERPVSFSATIVPEPSAASLMLAGLVALIGFGRIFTHRTNLNRYPLYRLGSFKSRQVMAQHVEYSQRQNGRARIACRFALQESPEAVCSSAPVSRDLRRALYCGRTGGDVVTEIVSCGGSAEIPTYGVRSNLLNDLPPPRHSWGCQMTMTNLR
jgi:hypothetical protein